MVIVADGAYRHAGVSGELSDGEHLYIFASHIRWSIAALMSFSMGKAFSLGPTGW